MRKYKIRKGTQLDYYDAEKDDLFGIVTERDVIYTDEDLFTAENEREAIQKYGRELVEALDNFGSDYPFRAPYEGSRTMHWAYFFVPDPKRPWIEVSNNDIEIVDE